MCYTPTQKEYVHWGHGTSSNHSSTSNLMKRCSVCITYKSKKQSKHNWKYETIIDKSSEVLAHAEYQLLLPVNKVCKCYVFTLVSHSVHGGLHPSGVWFGEIYLGESASPHQILWDMVNELAPRILLESILVYLTDFLIFRCVNADQRITDFEQFQCSFYQTHPVAHSGLKGDFLRHTLSTDMVKGCSRKHYLMKKERRLQTEVNFYLMNGVYKMIEDVWHDTYPGEVRSNFTLTCSCSIPMLIIYD